MIKMEAAGLRPGKGGQQTCSFSQMCTDIKLKCVEAKMNQLVDMMFEYQKQSGSRKQRGKEKVLLIKHNGFGSWQVKDDAQQEDTASK